jgi:hypothetical protein
MIEKHYGHLTHAHTKKSLEALMLWWAISFYSLLIAAKTKRKCIQLINRSSLRLCTANTWEFNQSLEVCWYLNAKTPLNRGDATRFRGQRPWSFERLRI